MCDIRALSRKALLAVLDKFPEEEEPLSLHSAEGGQGALHGIAIPMVSFEANDGHRGGTQPKQEGEADLVPKSARSHSHGCRRPPWHWSKPAPAREASVRTSS